MRTPVRLAGLIGAIGLGLLLLPATGRAKGQFETVEKFRDAEMALDVVTYQDTEATAARHKVGLLGIAWDDDRLAFAIGDGNCAAFATLWAKARQAPGDTWTVTGSMKDDDSDNASTITVMSGPGVKFTISRAQHEPLVFILRKADFDRFEAALNRVKAFLSN